MKINLLFCVTGWLKTKNMPVEVVVDKKNTTALKSGAQPLLVIQVLQLQLITG
jgi:hypothetical protein